MPQLGEIRKAQDCGYTWKGHLKCIWHACRSCGMERWVGLRYGNPESQLCKTCANRMIAKTRKCRSVNRSIIGQYSYDGYVFIYMPEHPHAKSNGYVKRARLVLEEKLGRYLLPDMLPHHKNRIRDDDRPENLKELTQAKHVGIHNKERVYA